MIGRPTSDETESQTGHRQDACRTARVLNKRHERMTDKQDGRQRELDSKRQDR
jgi:hypothetical protein